MLRGYAKADGLPGPCQVLERECTPEELAKKRRKLESKRVGPFQRVPYMLGIGMKRRALPDKEMPEWEEMCAVSAAVQNIYLAATAHGVAGVLPSVFFCMSAEGRHVPVTCTRTCSLHHT